MLIQSQNNQMGIFDATSCKSDLSRQIFINQFNVKNTVVPIR